MMEEKEKKVEYIELIYDLIFVYIIGRNNSLLHAVENGFIRSDIYLTYIFSMLIALHIWYLTTLFINRYGENDRTQTIGIFINMYLLYYMADATRIGWQEYYYRYNVAFGLILLNIALQYWLRLRKNRQLQPLEDVHIRYSIRVLLIEAGIVFLSLPIFPLLHIPFSPIAVLFSFCAVIFGHRINALIPVDFPHLTERVMLYVVFTFGEMIIGIAGYFEGGITLNNVYYSFMAFLVVAGLFFCYGFVYDHLLDRERRTTGTGYMALHVFLIIALNNITIALEFMREAHISEIYKNIFLVASYLAFFLFLFLLRHYAKENLGTFSSIRQTKHTAPRHISRFFAICSLFIISMILLYHHTAIGIAFSVAFVYAIYAQLRLYRKESEDIS